MLKKEKNKQVEDKYRLVVSIDNCLNPPKLYCHWWNQWWHAFLIQDSYKQQNYKLDNIPLKRDEIQNKNLKLHHKWINKTANLVNHVILYVFQPINNRENEAPSLIHNQNCNQT